jgi:hypothetical protein
MRFGTAEIVDHRDAVRSLLERSSVSETYRAVDRSTGDEV